MKQKILKKQEVYKFNIIFQFNKEEVCFYEMEKVNTESVVVIEKEENKKEPTEKTTECSTAKKIVTEVAEVFLSVIVFVASKTINGFKLLLYLFKYMCQ